jgi:hypothetical protein
MLDHSLKGSGFSGRSWLCIVRPGNWATIRKKSLFGVSERAHRQIAELKIGDTIAVHINQPYHGIVGICRVNSEVFRDDALIWRSGKYPWQVHVEVMQDFLKNKKRALPVSALLGPSRKGLDVAPYIIGKTLVQLSQDQSERVLALLSPSGTV